MATIFFQHQVNDYDAWRPYYDSDTERLEAAGLSEIGVFPKAGDKNLVLVVWGADSLDGFKAMLSSEGLKAKMQEAGVVGEPAVWIGEGM